MSHISLTLNIYNDILLQAERASAGLIPCLGFLICKIRIITIPTHTLVVRLK